MDLQITIVDIKGHCPVYKTGDTFYLKEGYILDPQGSCSVCMHSLASIMPYYTALARGINPADLGLAPLPDKPARIQCLDPCAYTGGGTVIMEIKLVEE
jgi:uncharacterized repeat protein (TIGR04076 family)